MTSTNDALRECPFCGEEASVIESGERFYVVCGSIDCYCALGEIWDRDAMPEHQFADASDAIAAWNTRAAPSDPGEVRALLEQAINFMRHSGLCAAIGGYGYCSCGAEKISDAIRALITTPIDPANVQTGITPEERRK